MATVIPLDDIRRSPRAALFEGGDDVAISMFVTRYELDEGPDLHAVQVSDRYIVNIITHGIPHEMPSFAKKHGVSDVTALTAYVRSLE